MNKQRPVMFTPDDIHQLWNVGEGIDDTQENIAKCEAVASIFSEALERCEEYGTKFYSSILIGVANVLLDYSQKASSIVDKTRRQFGDLYNIKRNESYAEGGGCSE